MKDDPRVWTWATGRRGSTHGVGAICNRHICWLRIDSTSSGSERGNYQAFRHPSGDVKWTAGFMSLDSRNQIWGSLVQRRYLKSQDSKSSEGVTGGKPGKHGVPAESQMGKGAPQRSMGSMCQMLLTGQVKRWQRQWPHWAIWQN